MEFGHIGNEAIVSLHKRQENTAHLLYLQIKGTCTGTIISVNGVLTSSRCMNGTAIQYYVSSGYRLLDNDKIYFVADIRRHSTSDLGILFIEGQFRLYKIQKLPDVPITNPDDMGYGGFGDLGYDNYTNIMRKSYVEKADSQCREYKNLGDEKNLECFKGLQEDPKDRTFYNPCQADLGAAIFDLVDTPSGDTLMFPNSVISYVDKCYHDETYPFLATKITQELLNWTKETVEMGRRKGFNEGPSLFFSPFLLVVFTVVQFFFF